MRRVKDLLRTVLLVLDVDMSMRHSGLTAVIMVVHHVTVIMNVFFYQEILQCSTA